MSLSGKIQKIIRWAIEDTRIWRKCNGQWLY